jgi:hypothetical protein
MPPCELTGEHANPAGSTFNPKVVGSIPTRPIREDARVPEAEVVSDTSHAGAAAPEAEVVSDTTDAGAAAPWAKWCQTPVTPAPLPPRPKWCQTPVTPAPPPPWPKWCQTPVTPAPLPPWPKRCQTPLTLAPLPPGQPHLHTRRVLRHLGPGLDRKQVGTAQGPVTALFNGRAFTGNQARSHASHTRRFSSRSAGLSSHPNRSRLRTGCD